MLSARTIVGYVTILVRAIKSLFKDIYNGINHGTLERPCYSPCWRCMCLVGTAISIAALLPLRSLACASERLSLSTFCFLLLLYVSVSRSLSLSLSLLLCDSRCLSESPCLRPLAARLMAIKGCWNMNNPGFGLHITHVYPVNHFETPIHRNPASYPFSHGPSLYCAPPLCLWCGEGWARDMSCVGQRPQRSAGSQRAPTECPRIQASKTAGSAGSQVFRGRMPCRGIHIAQALRVLNRNNTLVEEKSMANASQCLASR